MQPTGHQPARDVRSRAARFGLWRAAAAAPAMLGSLLLVTLASVTLGRWVGLLLPLAWAAGAAVVMTRVGERMILRAAFGFHRPSPAQAVALKPAWSAALGVTGTDAGDVELYVQTARAPNAYAAGGRSVAVTSRVVADYATGRLPEGQLVAVLVHELGHHATGATRPMLLLTWLTAPWCATAGLLAGLASTLAGRHPRQALGSVALAGLAVAATRTLQQGQWMAGGVLVVVELTAVFVPLANAAISRRSEYAADRFAADHGLAIELTAALRELDDGKRAPRGWSRLLSTHPTFEQRIKGGADGNRPPWARRRLRSPSGRPHRTTRGSAVAGRRFEASVEAVSPLSRARSPGAIERREPSASRARMWRTMHHLLIKYCRPSPSPTDAANARESG